MIHDTEFRVTAKFAYKNVPEADMLVTVKRMYIPPNDSWYWVLGYRLVCQQKCTRSRQVGQASHCKENVYSPEWFLILSSWLPFSLLAKMYPKQTSWSGVALWRECMSPDLNSLESMAYATKVINNLFLAFCGEVCALFCNLKHWLDTWQTSGDQFPRQTKVFFTIPP